MKIQKHHIEQASKVSNMVGAALFLGVQFYDLFRGRSQPSVSQTPERP